MAERVTRIRERIEELVEPSWEQQTQQVVKVLRVPPPPWRARLVEVPFDPDVHLMRPWFTRTRTVEHPSLVHQLEQAVRGGSSAGTSSSGYSSRPALSVPAVDALGMMHRETLIWLRSALRARVSADVSTNLRTIAGRAQDLDDDRLATLDGDVLRWWGRARIVTTWDSPPAKPYVPCMACSKVGALRVAVDRMIAVCLDCGATWDAATIGILGSHVQLALEERRRETRLAAAAAATAQPASTSGGRS